MIMLFNNYADEADVVLSAGSWALPLSNLKDPRPSKKARSSSAAKADTKFRVDLGVSRSFKALALTHTNLTSNALYRITRYSTGFAGIDATTGWLPVPGYPTEDPDNIGVSIFHVYAAAEASRCWEFEFDDEANAAGYVQLGRNCMMESWQPPRNFGLNNADGMEPNTQRQNSLGGVGYFNRRKPARFFNFGFEYLPAAEQPTLRRIRKICNLNKQVIVIPDPADTANLNDTVFLGTLKELPQIARLTGGAGSTAFQALEVV